MGRTLSVNSKILSTICDNMCVKKKKSPSGTAKYITASDGLFLWKEERGEDGSGGKYRT